jgi:AcrR family transcriptional regulator
MPKRSKEDTEITIQTIMDAVVEQMLDLGYDKMSYTTLSQQTGISRTGISHHFPRKTDFTIALDGKIFNMLVWHLDFEHGVDQFKESWIVALSSKQFTAILRLLFHHIISSERSVEYATIGLSRLYELVREKLGNESEAELEWLLGRSLISMNQCVAIGKKQ